MSVNDITEWPTEEWIQQAVLDDCTVKYASYDDWWDNHTSGISRLVRKLFVEDFVGRQISWEDYEAVYGY
jgi:hypothetical protein